MSQQQEKRVENQPRLVKLGDVSTWAIKPALDKHAGTAIGSKAPTGPVEIPPLPEAQARVFGPRKAWPGAHQVESRGFGVERIEILSLTRCVLLHAESKLTVKYPHGYCPVKKTLAPGRTDVDGGLQNLANYRNEVSLTLLCTCVATRVLGWPRLHRFKLSD